MPGAHLAYVINSLEGGGAALPVPAIAAALREQGVRVTVLALTRRNGLAAPAIEDAGFAVRVRDGGERDHVAAARWLTRELRRIGATHVWTSLSRATLLGLLVAPQLGLPVIAWQHNAFLKRGNLALLRMLQRRAALWVGDSPAVTQLTAKRLGVEKDRLACWPIYHADPQAPRAAPWQPGETLCIGSLGRLHPNKGYDVLFAALARLQAQGFRPAANVMIEIAGEGAEHARLEALAAAAGVTVSLPGYCPDPAAFLARQHLYLQPSRAEGFCLAAHEAMNAGLPVIGTQVGEMAQSIVPGETGWLAQPGDVASLANALQHALSEPEALAALGATAHERVAERYSPEAFAEAGKAVWRRVAKPVS